MEIMLGGCAGERGSRNVNELTWAVGSFGMGGNDPVVSQPRTGRAVLLTLQVQIADDLCYYLAIGS